MSRRYKGAIISATPPTTTGGESGTAPGEWTLQQQAQAQSGSVWPTQPLPKYIEDVFSTYLYDGTGGTQTITNGIDLATKGGMVWTKIRSAATQHAIASTATGVQYDLSSASTSALNSEPTGLTAFNTTGYTIGGATNWNYSGNTAISWTFRKQAKFFDVVTYTGTGSVQNIAHNLGSVPGCIIVKKTSGATNWGVYHRSFGNTSLGYLNLNEPFYGGNATWGSTTPTSTQFTVGADGVSNASGATYVAYLFAHNAGGFGSNFTDNVITCGDFTTNGSGEATVDLGYEPQWLLVKRNALGANWYLLDTVRGWAVDPASVYNDRDLYANLTNAEVSDNLGNPTATGFYFKEYSSATYVYIAVRKGPMKVPTDATKVFVPVARTGTGTNTTITVGFKPDLVISPSSSSVSYRSFFDRLRGKTQVFASAEPYLEADFGSPLSNQVTQFGSTTINVGVGNTGAFINNSGDNYINWIFQRAPGFFDQVCYTGNGGSSQTITHNLAAYPELMIVKARSGPSGGAWLVYSAYLGADYGLELNSTGMPILSDYWGYTPPTPSVFTVGTSGAVNASSTTYTAYLFASCPNVCKVGIYDGTSELTTINCEFTGGARFVMIKQTSYPGGAWYVWDTTRGMTAGTDPSIRLNSNAAQVSGNSVYTTTGGFQVLASPAVDINTAGATYIYIAIA